MQEEFIVKYLKCDLIVLLSSLTVWMLKGSQDTVEFESKPATDKESVKKVYIQLDGLLMCLNCLG